MERDRTLQRIQQSPECQKVSTPRQQRVSLIPLPVIKEPFERIATDIMVHLLCSHKGYRYMLVICDYATRYPEAIPLHCIDRAVGSNFQWSGKPAAELCV